jgi:hypothetical protein
VQLELLTPAGYASGTSIEDECRRAAALGDLITQPHAVPSENFYRRHSLPVHHSSPAFTPIEPTPVATPRVPARVPAGPSHIDSSASTTAYTEVIEDLSEHMNAVQIAGDGRILTVPYARKTLTIDGAKICKSTKYVSSAGIQMLDTLRYDDNAIAVINHIYLGSSVDRDEANPISFICELWRAGWSDGEDKASALFKTMKPIRGVSGSSAQV